MVPSKKPNNQSWLPGFFNDFIEGNFAHKFGSCTPAMNVIEDDESYNLELATPGMCKDDFKVHLSKDGNLVIEMEKKCENKEECKKDKKFLRKEFSYAKFHQTLILPENADKENIEATVKNGVLNIRVPKLQAAKTEAENRQIEVK